MKPKRIFLIRHGESEGNINWNIYSQKPDYALMLTDKGINQAIEVGKQIKSIIQNETYGIYYSPYFRARQTMDNAIKIIDNGLDYNKLRIFKREEPRIREQEYSGKLRTGENNEDEGREEYGKFFFRMNGGESGADVFDRVSDFLSTLNRDFTKDSFPENVLIFSHGMTNRLFVMRWFHIPIEEFETWKNPRNGEIYIMERLITGKYTLITPISQHESGYGYKYRI